MGPANNSPDEAFAPALGADSARSTSLRAGSAAVSGRRERWLDPSSDLPQPPPPPTSSRAAARDPGVALFVLGRALEGWRALAGGRERRAVLGVCWGPQDTWLEAGPE